jgi:hypothetical protein
MDQRGRIKRQVGQAAEEFLEVKESTNSQSLRETKKKEDSIESQRTH